MKKVAILATTILMSVAFISCEDETDAEKGEQAAIEFCSCRDAGGTMSECEDELKDKYTKSEYTSSDFVDAFNKYAEPSCDVTLEIYTY